VTLNIGATKKNASPSKPARAGKNRPLVQEAIDELSSWNPREFIAAFERWHQGSISLAHLNVLILLEAHRALRMTRLAEALDISVASVTGIVDRMEKRGLVQRVHDLTDRRVVMVYVADGGHAVLQDIDERRREGLAKLLPKLTDDQLRGLLDGHRALREARSEMIREGTTGLNDTAQDKDAAK
jgi:DNA-binding MarR family transcriptional regulator